MKRDAERLQAYCQYAHAIPERDFLMFPKREKFQIHLKRSTKADHLSFPKGNARTFPRGRCTSLLGNLVHDLRDDELDTPQAHDLPGSDEQVDPLRLKGFTKANCPIFPKGNVRNLLGRSSDATLKGFPKGNYPPSFRKEGSILRTETFGSHSFEDRPQVPTETVAEMYFQLAGKNLTHRQYHSKR